VLARPREGDWFALPLPVDGYAVGTVARAARRGHTLFGYFFGPIRSGVPSPADLEGYSASDAVYVCRFYGEGLLAGRWPIVNSSEPWLRGEWPMPEFHLPDNQVLAGQSFAVRYSEEEPNRFLGQREISQEEEADYPPDEGVFGTLRLERLVAELLGSPRRRPSRGKLEGAVKEGVTHWLLIPAAAVEEFRRHLDPLAFDTVIALDRREDGLVYVLVTELGKLDALRSTVKNVEAKLTSLARSFGGQHDGTDWALPE
jgi:hypothetical protein